MCQHVAIKRLFSDIFKMIEKRLRHNCCIKFQDTAIVLVEIAAFGDLALQLV